MKRRTKVVLGVFMCLLAAMGSLVWWQWNTVEAVVQATKYTSEEIEEKQKENKDKVHQLVQSDPSITVRDLTEEEKEALRAGTMTQEELAEKLLETLPAAPQPVPEKEQSSTQKPAAEPQPQVPQSSPAPQTPPAETPPAQSVVQDQWQRDISALIARVYVLQEKYTIALENMEDAAKEEYRGLRNRTKKAMMKFAQRYVSEALELEKVCDGEMDEIVTAMEEILTANGGDMTLVDTVVETYASEKSLKKAWYMAELEKRGWI